MDTLDERFLIYSALLVLCAFAGVFLGLVAASWTFFQVAAVIELVYWIGGPEDSGSGQSQSPQ